MVTRVRSPEWVYTYLREFYVDPSRPLGVNNDVLANAGMPHALIELQGGPTRSATPAATASTRSPKAP